MFLNVFFVEMNRTIDPIVKLFGDFAEQLAGISTYSVLIRLILAMKDLL